MKSKRLFAEHVMPRLRHINATLTTDEKESMLPGSLPLSEQGMCRGEGWDLRCSMGATTP